MKPCVMQLLVTLRPGGAERLALDILGQGGSRFRGLMAGLFHPPGSLAEEAEAKGLPAVSLRAETSSRFAAIRSLYRLLRRERVTLVHAQAGYLLSYALPACLLAGVPLVYTEHAVHSLETMPKLRLAVRLAAPFLRAVTCVNDTVHNCLVHTIGIRADRVTVVANGVDGARFCPEGTAAPLPWPGQKGNSKDGLVVFGNVARLCEAKDHATLLRAFAEVREACPQARLLLVGEGEKRPEIEGLIAELGLADCVHLAGESPDIPEHLRAMDVFVLSSRREGMPMAVLEAMACGLPVISTDVGSVARLNDAGRTVRLVPPRDAPALAAAMKELLCDPETRQSLALAGRERVLASHGAKAVAETYMRLYQLKGAPQ